MWRSLPFIAATFAFVAAVVGRAASDVPPLGWNSFAIAANVLLAVALFSLAWTLRWFWVVLRRREYEFPADDTSVRRYAEDMTEYHAALGLADDRLDSQVVEEMRLFMIDQYGSAARTNLRLNAVRLEARSKVLLFILIGFVLAFSCEATIFIHRDIYGPGEVHGGEERTGCAGREGAADQIGQALTDDGSPRDE